MLFTLETRFEVAGSTPVPRARQLAVSGRRRWPRPLWEVLQCGNEAGDGIYDKVGIANARSKKKKIGRWSLCGAISDKLAV